MKRPMNTSEHLVATARMALLGVALIRCSPDPGAASDMLDESTDSSSMSTETDSNSEATDSQPSASDQQASSSSQAMATSSGENTGPATANATNTAEGTLSTPADTVAATDATVADSSSSATASSPESGTASEDGSPSIADGLDPDSTILPFGQAPLPAHSVYSGIVIIQNADLSLLVVVGLLSAENNGRLVKDCDTERITPECVYSVCDPAVANALRTPYLDAGLVRFKLERLGLDVALIRDENNLYRMNTLDELYTDDVVTIEASGGEYPAFSADITIPHLLALTAPPAERGWVDHTLPEPLDLTWTNGVDGDLFQLETTQSLVCDYSSGAGAATVPSSVMSKLVVGENFTPYSVRRKVVTTAMGDIVVIARRNLYQPVASEGSFPIAIRFP